MEGEGRGKGGGKEGKGGGRERNGRGGKRAANISLKEPLDFTDTRQSDGFAMSDISNVTSFTYVRRTSSMRSTMHYSCNYSSQVKSSQVAFNAVAYVRRTVRPTAKINELTKL